MAVILKFEASGAKNFFFDRPRVLAKLDRMKVGGLKAAGAMTRKIARNSIRYGTKASSPGRPPRAHGNFSLLREFIYFVFDEQNMSCVVGPARTNQSRDYPIGKTVPAVLEFGGTIVFDRRVFFDKSESSGRVRRRVFEAVTRQMAPRPFMNPALEKAKNRYPKLFAGAFRGGGIG